MTAVTATTAIASSQSNTATLAFAVRPAPADGSADAKESGMGIGERLTGIGDNYDPAARDGSYMRPAACHPLSLRS